MKLIHATLLCMMTVSPVAVAAVAHGDFGRLPDGSTAQIFTLTSPAVEMRVTTFGARVVSLKTKDRNGKMGDVVLGYDDVGGYVNDTKTYFGAVPGRYANRIANGRFSLEGHAYSVSVNDGPNMLHGGKDGFERRNWAAKEIANGVEFSLVSPDGDQGFPGTLTAHVRYTLNGNVVSIQYSATTDKPTVVNLTNHAYFNLGGVGSGTILDEKLTIDADKFTPVNSTLIPTGELRPVVGTPFDFTRPEAIGSRIGANDEQLHFGKGYDHNWVLRGAPASLHPAAKVYDEGTGRVLSVATTEPGVQFYTGNFLDGSFSGPHGKYTLRTGLCLETQHFPDSPNHPAFPTTELKPGQTYRSETTWTFTTSK